MENKENEQKETAETTEETTEDRPFSELSGMVERLEKANEEAKKILLRHEEVLAMKLLSGKSDAGEKQEKKEETPEEYKERVMRGDIK